MQRHALCACVLSVLVPLCGCDPEGVIDDAVFEDPGLVGIGHEEIVLGEKLDDPYTVENMKQAYNAVYPTKSDREAVVTSDLYVRFLPGDGYDYSALERLGLNLVDHPLDYEILKYGDYYHDPSLPEDQITWQYAVVPSDFKFPDDIPYEVLDECFIPDNVPTRSAAVDWAAVEAMSFSLTGNELPVRTKSASVPPSGRITIIDGNRPGEEIGVAGVMVTVNSFVKVSTAYTDRQGYYSFDRCYSSNLHYRLVFKNRRGFGIGVNLLLIPASISTLGKGSPDGKSVCISTASERKLFCRCVVNNAANDYYQMCSEDDSNITPPPSNLRLWLFQNIGAGSTPMLQQSGWSLVDLVKQWLGEYSSVLNGFLPDITLGVKGLESYASVYTLAWHELAHASHFMQVGRQYWDKYIKFILTSFITSGGTTYGIGTETDAGYCGIGEMWAYYMETKLLQDKYDVRGYTAGSSYWFYPQIFLYLGERGLSSGQIFAALSPDVTCREELRTRLLSLYPSYRTVIRQVFERYQ